MHLIAPSGLQDLGGCWEMACCFPIAVRRWMGQWSLPQAPTPGSEHRSSSRSLPGSSRNSYWMGPNDRFICRKGAQGARDGAEAAVHFHMPPPRTGTRWLPADTWSHLRK